MHLREQEAATCIDDVEVKGLELEAHRATLEQEVEIMSMCKMLVHSFFILNHDCLKTC